MADTPDFTFEKANRLLDVARALREAPAEHAKRFTMYHYAWSEQMTRSDWRPLGVESNWCGSPACALGHYAARTDLQNGCRIAPKENKIVWADNSDSDGSIHQSFGMDWFGISARQFSSLFASNGCDQATTPVEAAEYIERFVLDRAAKELVRQTSGPASPSFHVEMQDYSRICARVFDHAFIKPLKLKLKRAPAKRKAAVKKVARKRAA